MVQLSTRYATVVPCLTARIATCLLPGLCKYQTALDRKWLWNHAAIFARWQHSAKGAEARFALCGTNCTFYLLIYVLTYLKLCIPRLGSAQAKKISTSSSSPQEIDPHRITPRPPLPQRPPPPPPMDFPPPDQHPVAAAVSTTDVDDFDDETEPELTFPEGDFRSTNVWRW